MSPLSGLYARPVGGIVPTRQDWQQVDANFRRMRDAIDALTAQLNSGSPFVFNAQGVAKGDGVTDDTISSRLIIDQGTANASSDGAEVIFGPGNYILSGNPFLNRMGQGNCTITVRLVGATWTTSKQIKVPSSTILEGTNRLRCGITAAASFIPSVAISTIARTGNVVTVATNAAHGLEVGATAVVAGVTTASFNDGWKVATVPSATSFTYAQTAANASDNTGTVFIPLVVWGDTEPFSHGTRLRNFGINTSSLTASVGIYTNTANELCTLEHLLIQNVGKYGLWIEQGANSPGSPNNYRVSDVEIYPLNAVSAKGIYARAATAGQHRGFDHITIVPTSAGAATLTAGIDASGISGVYSNIHVEGCADGVLIGGRVGADTSAGSGASSAGVVVQGVTGDSNTTTTVRLANGAEMHDIVVQGIAKRGGTNVFKDDFAGLTLTRDYMGFYAFGIQGSPTRWGSDPGVDWRINSNIRIVGKIGLTPAGGGSAPDFLSGAGSPETVVTAVVGSVYLRNDGGAGTSLYIKESGTGNTGWIAK